MFSRAAIFAVTGWSLWIDPRLHRPGAPLATPAIEGLCRWDCGWFVRIAIDGYAQRHHSNFFPLFPLLGRYTHDLTGMPHEWALVLWANAFGLLGLVVVYRIFQALHGDDVALTGVTLLAAWPFSFFQAAGYPESMMLASTALGAWFAMNGRHLSAGAALGVGLLGRHLTVLGGGALLVAQLLERGRTPVRFFAHRAFLGLLLPFAIAGLYFGFLQHRFGDGFAFLEARGEGWGEAAWFGVHALLSGRFEPQIYVYAWLSLIPGVGAVWLLRDRRHWILAGYAIPLMLTLWAIGLMGLGRYTQAAWPAFLPFALWLQRHRPEWRMPIVLALAMGQAMFLYLYVHSYPIN